LVVMTFLFSEDKIRNVSSCYETSINTDLIELC
jgi:hypothetical protein